MVSRRPIAPIAIGVVLAVLGAALAAGGAWLIALGGSWYYAIAGMLLAASGILLAVRNAAAVSVYALLLVGTLAFSVYEVGLDWWALAPRGGLFVVIALVLLLPVVTFPLRTRGERRDDVLVGQTSAFRGPGLSLTAAVILSVVVAGASLALDPHRIDGTVAAADQPSAAPDDAAGDEWLAYGGNAGGQRYSTLADLTPDALDGLEVAWTYNTGDIRGPGDPTETTFQVTPLKIDDRLFLCTPHQNVIALDAVSGEEMWRYEPQVQGELALQHLTCRGLSYQAEVPAAAEPAAEDTAAAPAPAENAAGATPIAGPQDQPNAPNNDPQLPVVAQNAATTASCTSRLFMPTADGRLIALNPEDGTVCADFGGGDGQIDLWSQMPNVNPGAYYSTSPVVVTPETIIVGGTVLDNVSTQEASGVIRGYSAATGDLVWAWDSGNPERTEPLGEGETYTPNSPNSWSIMSADLELGLVYVPLGNQPPDQFGGNRSEAVERYSSSVVALDIATGAVRWSFQTVHHDLWDYDVPSQPTLVDIDVDGTSVPALVQPTKQGELFVLDRRTGEPVLPVTEVEAPTGAAAGDFTAPTQPVSALSFNPPPLTGADMWGATPFDQLACRIAFHELRYEGRFTPPSVEGSLIYPGNFGVFNWGGIAVDPVRQIVFATPTYLAFTSRLVPRSNDTSLYVQEGGQPPAGALPALNENFGAPYAVEMGPLTSVLGLPCQTPPWGYVAAADLRTGEVIWQHRNGTTRDASPVPLPFEMGVPNLGGPLVTAGGTAFLSGTIDDYVRGYDVATGEEIWRARLPAGGQATPMTYRGADGRQYLVVVAGGHGSLGTKAGDAVIAYALPKAD